MEKTVSINYGFCCPVLAWCVFVTTHKANAANYNTPVNSDHRISLTKTLKFTHYVKDKKETQCSLQSPSG
ncbi:MAG: hypothetical protein WC939_05025, partial [Acholeplasmataceae bacterium]